MQLNSVSKILISTLFGIIVNCQSCIYTIEYYPYDSILNEEKYKNYAEGCYRDLKHCIELYTQENRNIRWSIGYKTAITKLINMKKVNNIHFLNSTETIEKEVYQERGLNISTMENNEKKFHLEVLQIPIIKSLQEYRKQIPCQLQQNLQLQELLSWKNTLTRLPLALYHERVILDAFTFSLILTTCGFAGMLRFACIATDSVEEILLRSKRQDSLISPLIARYANESTKLTGLLSLTTVGSIAGLGISQILLGFGLDCLGRFVKFMYLSYKALTEEQTDIKEEIIRLKVLDTVLKKNIQKLCKELEILNPPPSLLLPSDQTKSKKVQESKRFQLCHII